MSHLERLFAPLLMGGCLAWPEFVMANGASDFLRAPATCEQCHGRDGNSGDPSSPSLAGQNAAYLRKQIIAFRDGARRHPFIKSTVLDLNENQVAELTAYFSSKAPPSAGNGPALQIFSACAGCHGTRGEGVGPYPRIAGQQPEYLRRQMINFKSGARKNILMKTMLLNLSENDINVLANHLAPSD